jgi:CheY-like chemotaxis protein
MSHDRDRLVWNELVDWLVSIESLAHDVYKTTANALRADPEVSRFVDQLADNEEQHAELMTRIRDVVAKRIEAPPPDIRLNAALRERVESPLRRLQAEVASGTITQKRTMALIAEVEFSEWNDIFLYVLRKFGKQGREMEMISATIQEHKRSIEAFIAMLPPHVRPELDVAKLSNIWEIRLLLVDDSRIVRELLVSILKSVGQVTATESGEKALKATRAHFFDAVVSDIRMPGISGIDFHRQAVAEHPDLQNRFVFISFDPREDEAKYLTDHQIPLVLKPFSAEELTEAVYRITSTTDIANKASGGDVH